MLVYTAGELPIASAHHVHQLRLELHRIDRASSGTKCLQNRAPCAGAEHQHARPFHQPIGQRGSDVLQIRGRRRRRIVTHYGEGTVRVDEQRHLLRDRSTSQEAQSRRTAQRHLAILDRAHHAERSGAGLGELRAGDPERLGQGLERRNPKLAGHAQAREHDHDTAQQQQRPSTRALPASCDRKRACHRAEPAYEVESPFRRNQVEHAHRCGGADPGPREIRGVHLREAIPENHQRASDSGGGEEERDRQHHLDDQQPAERAG